MVKEKKDNLPEKGSGSPFKRFEKMAKRVVSAPKVTEEKRGKNNNNPKDNELPL